jgi:hypothetical protein
MVKVARSNSPERRQRLSEEKSLLPDWLGGGRTVVTEAPQTQPAPTASVLLAAPPALAAASAPLPQPVGERFQGYGGVNVFVTASWHVTLCNLICFGLICCLHSSSFC